jgi:excisionase family DNA binding protein
MATHDTAERARQGDDAPALDSWLKLAEAASLAGVSAMSITRLVRRGELPFVQTPAGRLFPASAMAEYRAKRDRVKRLSRARTSAVVRTAASPPSDGSVEVRPGGASEGVDAAHTQGGATSAHDD